MSTVFLVLTENDAGQRGVMGAYSSAQAAWTACDAAARIGQRCWYQQYQVVGLENPNTVWVIFIEPYPNNRCVFCVYGGFEGDAAAITHEVRQYGAFHQPYHIQH